VEKIFGGSPPEYQSYFRVFGKNGVMGDLESNKGIHGHELGIVQEVIAPTQEDANIICHGILATLIHKPLPEWPGAAITLGRLPAPGVIERGPFYRYNMHHIVLPEDPFEMFPIEYEDV
jgi:hypothetical protein